MEKIKFSKSLIKLTKLLLFSVFIGLLGGFIGGVFAHTLSFVTASREAHSWLIFLLPVGAVATVLLYRFSKLGDFRGTDEIIKNLEDKKTVKPLAAPLIFIATAITHLLGGSAGREGAALQLGGAGAGLFAKAFKLNDDETHVLVKCGMSAVFASVFGTPLTAAFFVLEFKATKKIFGFLALPCFASAIVATLVAHLLKTPSKVIDLGQLPDFSLVLVAKMLLLAVALGALAWIVCFSFHNLISFTKKLISNPFVRAVVFSCAVVGLTMLVGDMRYNGAGMDMATAATRGDADWYDFVLKIVFTAITLAAGLKGGEIVPTFCIGATFGCVLGGLLGLEAPLAAALGLVGLFCSATNSPVSAIFLGMELFGFACLPYFAVTLPILWLVSAKHGLFENRFFKSPFSLKKA